MSKKIVYVACHLSILLFINGCASLSKNECNEGNWSKIGNKDANRGLLAEKQLRKHRSACAKYQKTPNKAVYYSGYNQGLKQFCVNDRGFRHGSNGSEYFANCPAHLERNFLKGYVPGLESVLNRLEDDLESLRYDQDRVELRLIQLRHAQRLGKKHKKRIKQVKNKLEGIQSSIDSKRDDIRKFRSWRSRWLYKLDY